MESLNWWGTAGVQNTWEPLAFARQHHPDSPTEGVSRYVDPNVTWESRLPWAELGMPTWYADPSYEGHFEMPLRTRPTIDSVWSLRRLGQSLVQTPPRGPDDERVVELDGVAQRLLEIGSILHASGWRLGALRPDNVLFFKGTSGREVVLPDIGFQVASETYDADWLRGPEMVAICSPLSPLQQHLHHGLSQTGAEPDVRLLARLLAATLLGGQNPVSYARNTPLPQGMPWTFPTTIPPVSQAPRLYADVWGVLSQTCSAPTQQIRSMTELRDALRLSPLADHFGPPRRPRTGKTFFWTGAAAVLIVGGALATWAALTYPSKNGPKGGGGNGGITKNGENGEPSKTPVKELTDTELQEEIEVIVKRGGPKGAEMSEPMKKRLDEVRSELVRRVRREMQALLEAFMKDPRPPQRGNLYRGLSELKRLLVETKQLVDVNNVESEDKISKEEASCIEQLDRRLRQLDY